MSAVAEQRDLSEVLVGMFILAVINYPMNGNTLVDIFGGSVMQSTFTNNSTVRELIDYEKGRLRMRSSVAARYLLSTSIDPNIIVNVLVKIASVSDRNSRILEEYRQLIKSITVFSNLQDLLPEKGRRKAIISYYESIKSLDSLKTAPLFWLQYAIACLVLEDFERSGRYFETAYSYAKKRGRDYDTFQIDNHYARFLLVNSIHSGEEENYMTSFRRARNIVNDQINKRERETYPFRVASNYEAFFDKFEAILSEKDKDEIVRAAEHVMNRISRMKEHRRKERYIAECADHMESLILRIRYDMEK